MKKQTWKAAVSAAAIAVGAALPSWADYAGIAIARAGNTLNVSVPANTCDDTSKLYLVWDESDRGTELASWPQANRLEYGGALSSAAAICQFDASGIPGGSIVRAIATSDIRLIDGWVSLGNGQYVNTGIKGNEAYGIEIKFRRTGASKNWASLTGSYHDNFTIGQNNNSQTQCYLRYQTVNGGLSAFSWSGTATPHTIRLMHSCTNESGRVNSAYVDVNKVTLTFDGSAPSGSLGTDACDILVGTCNDGSGLSYDGRYYYAEWHYATIYDANGDEVRHLVPALRGGTASPQALFYDTVSGECFANAGSGNPGYATSATVTNTIPYIPAFSDAVSMSSASKYATAHWTGLGNRANVNDQANWAYTNAAGVAESAAPDAATIVYVNGATDFNVPAGQVFSCKQVVMDDCTLTADCDWRGLAAVHTVDDIEELEYLDAPKGAYIDTGFAPNQNTRVVIDVTVQNTVESWFGATDDSTDNWWKTKVFSVSNNGVPGVYSGFGNTGGDAQSAVPVGRHTIDYDKGALKVDGVAHAASRSGQTFQLSNSLYIFADHRPQSPWIKEFTSVRLHSCKIYDNGTLVRDYVPVSVGGEIGLYDKENGEFAWNIGSGSFSAGSATGETFTRERILSMPIDVNVDLAGHRLTLARTDGAGTITSASGGEVIVDVAQGATVVNTTLALTGGLTLVKTGDGEFHAEKTSQTYTGGTIVSNGTMRAWNNCYPSDDTHGHVTVCKGAVFDVDGAGSSNFGAYAHKNASVTCLYTLDGGTLANLGGYIPYSWTMLSRVQLTADSTINAAADFGFINAGHNAHTLDLDGHRLGVTVANGKSFYLYNLTVRHGTFAASGAGTLTFDRTAFNGENADFDINCIANINLANISMSNLTWGASASAVNNNNKISVYGSLKPVGTKFPNIEMKNNSTLDLSSSTLPWSTTASQNSKVCSFANDATAIYVKLGDRKVSSKTPIVTWDAKPANTVKFKFADEGRTGSLVAKDDGLYVMPGGFMIIVK